MTTSRATKRRAACGARSGGWYVITPLAAALALALGTACGPTDAPILGASSLGDTRDAVGPYVVSVWIVSTEEVVEARLYHREAGSETLETLPMEEVAPGLFEAGIPGRPPGARVHWHVAARDVRGGIGHAPPTAAWGDQSCFTEGMSAQAPPDGGAAYCFDVLHQ